MPCTDFSVSQDMSAGQASSIINLPPNILIALQFTGGDWVALGTGGGQWAVTTQIRYCFFFFQRPNSYMRRFRCLTI